MSFWDSIEHVLSDRLVLIATPIFLLCILLEYLGSRREHPDRYVGKDTLASLSTGILALLVEFVPKVLAFTAFTWLWLHSPLAGIVGRQWWAWVLLFFLEDFTYYWFHRLNHEVRIFWAGHVSHHSSVHLNLGTALRQGVGERLHKFVFWMWLPLLGFDPLMVFTMMGVSLIYQFFIHTEAVDKLPAPIEFIFNTPSHHRVHHASNTRYLDRNHAGVLIIWDRIFGTFSEEKEEKPVYGLTKNIEDHHLLNIATHEYRAIGRDVLRAKKLGDKLKYIFYPPGWSHDGPDLRAKTLRKQVKP